MTLYFFSTNKTETDQYQSVGGVLEGFGGVRSSRAKMVDLPTKVRKVVPFTNVSKKPVPLTVDNFHLVHEPAEYGATIRVEFSEENLRQELLPVDERGDGYWGGTEASRVLYLRKHHKLWAWLKETQVRRHTGVFFITQNVGDPRLRKILAILAW